LIKGLPDLAEEIVMADESGFEIRLMSGESFLFVDAQTGAFLSKVA
jgi:hypothetical protein